MAGHQIQDSLSPVDDWDVRQYGPEYRRAKFAVNIVQLGVHDEAINEGGPLPAAVGAGE